MASALEEAIRTTTTNFIKSFVEAAQQKNACLVSQHTAPDCKRHIGPPAFLAAVGAPSPLVLTNEQYEAEFGDMHVISMDEYEVHNLTVDATNRKAACWSVLKGEFIDGTTLSRMHSWFLDLNEDGSKIVEIYQWNDVEEGKLYREKVAALNQEYPSRS